MTQRKHKKVIMPIGPAAGQALDLPCALSLLSIEAMGARSDILEPMNRKPEAEKLGALAFQMERAAFALAVIAWQLDPKPTAGYIDRARELVVTLPPGFTEEKMPKNTNFIPKKDQKDFLSD